jgi:hypothetical protein
MQLPERLQRQYILRRRRPDTCDLQQSIAMLQWSDINCCFQSDKRSVRNADRINPVHVLRRRCLQESGERMQLPGRLLNRINLRCRGSVLRRDRRYPVLRGTILRQHSDIP